MSGPDEASSITTRPASAAPAHATAEKFAALINFPKVVGQAIVELRDRIAFLEGELRTVQDHLGFIEEPVELTLVANNPDPRPSEKKANLRLVAAGEGA